MPIAHSAHIDPIAREAPGAVTGTCVTGTPVTAGALSDGTPMATVVMATAVPLDAAPAGQGSRPAVNATAVTNESV